MFDEDESMDELLEAYSSKEDIQNAMGEKAKGEQEEEITDSEQLRSYPKPQRELDLHGHTTTEAKREIENFLFNAKVANIKTVRIITGKGVHSPNFKSVLPEITEQKIAEMRRKRVVFSFKKEKTGGAFIVYLAE